MSQLNESLFKSDIVRNSFLTPEVRLNDAITSITAGSVSQITILFRIEAYGRYLYPVRYLKNNLSSANE